MSSVVQQSEKRKTLDKHLWNAAFKDCGAMNDNQSVRWKREGACLAVTQRTRIDNSTSDYKDLTIEELEYALEYLRKGPKILDTLKAIEDDHKGRYATKAQLGKLHYNAQVCGIHYAKCDLEVEVGDLILKGDELRKEMCGAFERGKLTGFMQKYLYSSWINPKVHEFLKEAKLRYETKFPEKPYYVNYQEITREEADALIVRFQKIINEIQERYTPVKPSKHSMN